MTNLSDVFLNLVSSGPSTSDMGTETHGRDSEENQRARGRGRGEEYVFSYTFLRVKRSVLLI